VNSNGVLSMDLVTTTSGMGTHMLESILQTRCMAMGFINLQMGIVMKAHGMMEGNKV
jgi:hypothetical protein